MTSRDPAAPRRPGSGGRTAWIAIFLLVLAAPARWQGLPAGAATKPAITVPLAGATPARGRVERHVVRAVEGESYLLYVPAAAGPGARLFVDVHGKSRNVEEHATLLAPFAERYGVILIAPCFTEDQHAGYQWLEREPDGHRADEDLDRMIEDAVSLTKADAARLYLFGFSGGAQFVHRYALAHPERVAGVVVASAGWFTFPDSTTPYPYGTGASAARGDLRFEPHRYLRVPFTVVVGGADTGSESLRQNPDLDRQQGTMRKERARRWVDAMRAAATARGLPPLVTGSEVPGIHHSFSQFMQEGDLGNRVFTALFGAAGAPKPEAVRSPAGGTR